MRALKNVFLQSERLYFRRYGRSDLDFLAGLFADREVMRFIGNGALLDRAAVAARLESWLERPPDRGFFLALTKTDDTAVGHAALIVQSVDGRDEPEVGWWLAPSAWGHGYAAEAGAAFRDYAFDIAGFDRIIHLIQPANVRSAAVARRIGSTFERATNFRGNPVHVYAQVAQPRADFGNPMTSNSTRSYAKGEYGPHANATDERQDAAARDRATRAHDR